MLHKKYETYKIGIFGESKCGKTSLILKYLSMKNEKKKTKGEGPTIYSTIFQGRKKIYLLIWDLPGDPNFIIREQYFPGLDGMIFAYDVTNQISYDNVVSYIKMLKEKKNFNDISIVIVGCKNDFPRPNEVFQNAVHRDSLAYDALFFVTSSKTGEGIELCFESLVNSIEYKKKISSDN